MNSENNNTNLEIEELKSVEFNTDVAIDEAGEPIAPLSQSADHYDDSDEEEIEERVEGETAKAAKPKNAFEKVFGKVFPRAPKLEFPPQEPIVHDPDNLLEVRGLCQYFPIKAGFFKHTVGYVRAVDDLPRGAEKIVLVGEAGKEFLGMARRPRAQKLVFLSPPFHWQLIPEELRARSDVSFVIGAHAARLAFGKERLPSWARIIPGAELYFPAWLDFVL